MSNKPLSNKVSNRDGIYTYSLSNHWNNFCKEIGIDVLTGEACALSMRLLCELNETAVNLYLEFFGLHIPLDSIPHSHYNDRSKYALFLDRETIETLIIFYLCHFFNYVQLETVKQGSGFNPDTRLSCYDNPEDWIAHIKQYKDLYDHMEGGGWIDGAIFSLGRVFYTYANQPRRGFSNVHGFSGISQ